MVGHSRPLRSVKGPASTCAVTGGGRSFIYWRSISPICILIARSLVRAPVFGADAQRALRYVYVCDIQTAWGKTI